MTVVARQNRIGCARDDFANTNERHALARPAAIRAGWELGFGKGALDDAGVDVETRCLGPQCFLTSAATEDSWEH